jgi:hypothetical protein
VIRDHRFYEMQSALSATGNLTDSELEELEQHVSQCVSCGKYMMEMAVVSRELFLNQVQPGKYETPKGMQRRFIQRAAAAGVPLKAVRASSAVSDLSCARVAAITVLLALLISIAWRASSKPRVQLASGLFSSKTEPAPEALSPGIPQASDGRVRHAALVYKGQTERRLAARGRTAPKGPPIVTYGAVSRLYIAESRPLFANRDVPVNFSDGTAFWSGGVIQSYFADGVYSVSHASFTRTYAAPLFGGRWDSKPEKRSFRFDLTPASFTRSNSPLNTSASALVPSLKFNAPVFRIDPTRSW